MNYQFWNGVPDPRYGYGSMLSGFLGHVPEGVKITEKATVDILMSVPFAKEKWLNGVHRVCFTMWETDKLPGSFIRWLPQYDLILVPCQHNVELFSQHHPDVKYVPLGVDTEFWTPSADPTGKFRFIAGGSLWMRKGLDAVVAAFKQARLPDAELIIKAAPHARDVPDKVESDNIKLLRNWMSLEEQRDWFRSGHVYLAPARGEGFGLMPLQAISSGVPTILSDSSGQAQFAHLGTGVVSHRKSSSPSGGNWDEPNVGHLVELMRDHYQRWDHHRQRALLNATYVADSFSWNKAAEKLVEAVPVGRLSKATTFIQADVQVTVTFAKNVEADIGKHHYSFRKGETATIPEGVHQVLYDAGMIA